MTSNCAILRRSAQCARNPAAVRASLPSAMPRSIDADNWTVSAASVLLNRTLAQLPKQVWDESSEQVISRFRELLTPEAATTALSDQLCRFELSVPTMRTLDGRLFKLASSVDSGGGASLRAPHRSCPPDAARPIIALRAGMPPSCSLTSLRCRLPSRRPTSQGLLVHSMTIAGTLGATLDVGKTHWKSTARLTSRKTARRASRFNRRRSMTRLCEPGRGFPCAPTDGAIEFRMRGSSWSCRRARRSAP